MEPAKLNRNYLIDGEALADALVRKADYAYDATASAVYREIARAIREALIKTEVH